MDEYTKATYAQALYGGVTAMVSDALKAEHARARQLNHVICGAKGAQLPLNQHWIVARLMELEGKIAVLESVLTQEKAKKQKVA